MFRCSIYRCDVIRRGGHRVSRPDSGTLPFVVYIWQFVVRAIFVATEPREERQARGGPRRGRDGEGSEGRRGRRKRDEVSDEGKEKKKRERGEVKG